MRILDTSGRILGEAKLPAKAGVFAGVSRDGSRFVIQNSESTWGDPPRIRSESFTIYDSGKVQPIAREHLADANIHILDALKESKLKTNGLAFKERSLYEKKTRDPDDCYLDVIRREEERRQQGLPSLIGIQRGMRRATSEEILEEIHGGLDGDSASLGEDKTGALKEESEVAEIDMEREDGDERRRQRIIQRVISLRTARTMTEQEFRTLIGPSTAKSWTGFVETDANDAWCHGTPEMFERIAKVLGIGSGDLLG